MMHSFRSWQYPARLVLVAALTAGAAAAAERGTLPAEAKAAMAAATRFMQSVSTEGGYVWRYSLDLQQRHGEAPTTATQIWVQPPGTTSMGMAFLRAYTATRDGLFLEAAQAAADVLARGQLESGGWDYLVECDPVLRAQWYRREDIGTLAPAAATKRKNLTTFDDDNTQAALRLLVAVAAVAGDSQDARDVRIRTARDYGLAKLVAAQRPNGGWPQRWNGVPVTEKEYPALRATVPKEYPRQHANENYYGHHTLNDQTHRDCVMTVLDAAKRLKRPDLRAAALRGGDFLLAAQLPEPQPAWAQQYNARMEPAWARAFEPPAVSSNESGGALHLLLELYLETGDEKYLEPVPRAIAWFKRSEIAPGRWARLYELGTNTPIYGDRDGKIHYTIAELSPERQRGYSWSGDYGVSSVMTRFEKIRERRAANVARLSEAKGSKDDSDAQEKRTKLARQLEPRVREIVAALDANGRWISRGRGGEMIRSDTFIANLNVLSEYLEAAE